MKKIAIILVVLSLTTWAIGETRIDPTKENAFTHIKRIRNYVLAMSPSTNDPVSTEFKLKAIAFAIYEFKWTEDDIEHLQYPYETIQKKTGDCEDFTIFFLAFARASGHPIQRLGMVLIVPNNKQAHLVPLYREDDNTWWIWESGVEIGKVAPLAWYLSATENLNRVIIFMGFEDNSTVTVLNKTHWFTETLIIWMKNEETRIKAKGYAIE